MLPRETPCRIPLSRHSGSGFTLLELLVAMFIVGVIAGMAMLSVGIAARDQGTSREIQRLTDLLALASEQAVLEGREYGLSFYAREYAFSRYDYQTGQWWPVEAELPVAGRQLPPTAVLDLYLEGRQTALPEEAPDAVQDPAATEDRKGRSGIEPQVFILSSGDLTPFELHLRPAAGQPGIRLRVSDSGASEQLPDER